MTTPADDTYLTIEAPAEAIYKEKSSKFLAFAYPVAGEEEIRSGSKRCANVITTPHTIVTHGGWGRTANRFAPTTTASPRRPPAGRFWGSCSRTR